jgi:type VI secretion system FHA domain protein
LNPVEPSASRPGSGCQEPAISPFAKSSSRPDPVADLHGREPSIDDVMGGRNSAGPDPLGVGPQPGRVFLPPDAMDPVDPLEAMGGVRKSIPPPTIPDHDQELKSHYVPPMAKLDTDLEPKAEPLPPAALPSFPPPPARPLTSSASGVASERGERASLLRALLTGAGIPDADQPNTLTPEMMEAVGGLLRAAVQGTLDLLHARGLMKSEMRADVTMIKPVDNNPLKFSPSVEAALVHLLAPHVRGFMPPLRAMKAAYDDLRAHQLGFLAGMRAALDEVLARFAPEELGKRLADPTVLDSLLPMNRKAKRWDLFVEHYGEIAAEAREDFNAAFGKAFLRAYEAQVKRLRAEEGR